MLPVFDPSALRLVIDEAHNATRAHWKASEEMMKKYRGPFWVDRGEQEGWASENTYFKYVSAMLPRLAHKNPRTNVKSRRGGPQAEVADAMQHGLNRIVKDQKMVVVFREVIRDMMFGWGVTLVKEDTRSTVVLANDDPLGVETIPTWPVVERIPPKKFIMDPEANDLRSCRFMGHEWRMDKDDLRRRAEENPDEGWDLEEIEAMAIKTGEDRDSLDDGRHAPAHAPRQTVTAYEVWFPEVELEESEGSKEGYHGTIFTIAVSGATSGAASKIMDAYGDPYTLPEQKEGYLRDPRPYYGPASGPYTVFGAYTIADSPYPLAPLVACEGQIQDLNTHVHAADASALTFKRVIAVNSAVAAEKIANAKHQSVVVVDFEDGDMQAGELTFGGAAPEQHAENAVREERVGSVLGIDEALAGQAEAGVTATATTTAYESATLRISDIKEAKDRALVDVLEKCAWYMYYSDTIVFPLGPEALESQKGSDVAEKIPEYEGLEIEPWFRGGDPDNEAGYSYYDLELEIEPYSTERTSQGVEQQRALQTHELVVGSLPMMKEFFDFPWPEHFKSVGEKMNIDGMDKLVPPEMLERFKAEYEAMMQGMVQGQTDPFASTSPRMGAQVGRGGGGGQPGQGGGATRPSQASQGQGRATGARISGQGMQGQQSGARAQGGR